MFRPHLDVFIDVCGLLKWITGWEGRAGIAITFLSSMQVVRTRPGLFINKEDEHWIKDADAMKDGEKRTYDVRIRYRQPLFIAELEKTKEGLIVRFAEKQKAVAKGQFAAWYKDDVLMGSGVIDH